MDFRSDNISGIHPNILDAIIQANQKSQSSYGGDTYTKKLKEKCNELFETEVHVFLTSTGTAANCIGLSALVKPYETLCCHEEAHINTDECGAFGLFSGGAKLVSLPGTHGKLHPETLKNYIENAQVHSPHGGKPSAITITQATECGTLYTLEELRQLSEFAKSHRLSLHMDGARFANSLATLNCSPAEATWKAGIDAMTFGATKNGTMAGEAVIIFNKKYAENSDYIQMRAGQLTSKMRFSSCQFLAYLENDLWLNNAKHANTMAQKLLQLFNHHNLKTKYPVQANELFVTLPQTLAHHLQTHEVKFYNWGNPSENLYRFLTSWSTTNEDLENLGKCLKLFLNNPTPSLP